MLRVISYIEGPLSQFVTFTHFLEGVHIGARVLLDLNLIWFVYNARLSQWV
jgi:hypothetical protein